MSAYRRDFNETKYMSFLINNDEFLEKHNEFWEKVRNSIKKEFDIEPRRNEKYKKTGAKSYNEKVSTDFYNNKIPKEGFLCICLSVILIFFKNK